MPDPEAAVEVPLALQGAWLRTAVQLGDGEVFESHLVHYLQAGSACADLRTPFVSGATPGTGFAGTCSWDAPWATWIHELDLATPGGLDRGRLRWLAEDELEERGEWATPEGAVPYVERWRRLSGSSRPVVALRSDDPPARFVQVGDHAIVLWDERSTGGGATGQHLQRTASGWEPVHAVGAGRRLHAPPPVPEEGDVVHHEGVVWQVVERRR